jgi:hypothetical protein
MPNTEMLNTGKTPEQVPAPESARRFVFVRERTLGEVIRDTTTILRQHFSAVFDPFFVSGGIGALLTWAAVRSGRQGLIVGAGILSVFLVSFASAAAKMQIGELAAGRRPRLGHALKTVTTTLLPTLLATTFLVWAAVGVASMFIVPAFILWLRLMYTQHFIVLEGAGWREALEGSAALARGHSMRGLAVLAYAFAPQVVTVALALVLLRMGVKLQGPLGNVMYSLFGALLFVAQPVLAVATTLLYFDLRVRDGSIKPSDIAGSNADH